MAEAASSNLFAGSTSPLRPGLLLPAFAAALLCVLLSLQILRNAEETAASHESALFAQRAEEIRAAIKGRMQAYHQVLRGGVGLFAASESVSRAEWTRYVGHLDLARNHPGIHALSFDAWVQHAEKVQFLQARRAELGSGFEIFPPGTREHYVVVDYVEPPDLRNRTVFGFDTHSEPSRRQAGLHARDSGETTLTAPLQLKIDGMQQDQTGLLMLAPVYRSKGTLPEIAGHQAEIAGFVAGVFIVDEFMRGVLGADMDRLDLFISDASAPGEPDFLFESRPGAPLVAEVLELPIEMFGRRWRMQLTPRETVSHPGEVAHLALIRSAGVLLSIAAFILVWLLLRLREVARLRQDALAQVQSAETTLRAVNEELRGAHDLWQKAIDHLPVGVFMKDVRAGYLQIVWNKEAERIFGYSAEQILGTTDHDIWPHEQAAFYRSKDEETMRVGRMVDIPHEFNDTPHRGRIILHTRKVPLYDASGAPSYLLGICEDVTERQQLQARLELADKVFTASGEAIIVTDPDVRIVAVNPAFVRLSGYSLEEVQGHSPKMLASGNNRPGLYAEMWQALAEEGRWQGEIIDRRKDGSTYPKWLCIDSVRNQSGVVINYVGLFADISERKQMEQALRYVAEHDALTGLPNRLLLADRFAQAAARARRSTRLMAVMFLDLDHFKAVNDTLGHDAGDLLLRSIAARLERTLRTSDSVVRLGGDEFVILLAEIAGVREVKAVAGKLMEAVAQPFDLAGEQRTMTFSLGISLYPAHGDELDALIRCADLAMYAAKRAGRNRYRIHEPVADASDNESYAPNL